MNKIEQAIFLVEKIGPSLAKDIAAKEAALAALRSIPGPATENEAFAEFRSVGDDNTSWIDFSDGFRAAELRIYGDG